jgi:hypothetical protein
MLSIQINISGKDTSIGSKTEIVEELRGAVAEWAENTGNTANLTINLSHTEQA